MIKPLTLLPLWIFQISSQMIAMSNFRKTLIILGLDIIAMLLKIWLFFMIVLTISAKIRVLVFLRKYGIPIIFKYDLDWGSLGALTFSKSIWYISLTYFSIFYKSNEVVILLVTIIISVWLKPTKSAMTSNLILLSILLRLVIYELKLSINLFLFLMLIKIIICFLDGSLVVIFNLGFGFPDSLTILWILLVWSLGNTFLIFKISLVDGIDACAYNLTTSFFSDVLLVFFLKYLEISFTFFWVLAEIGDGSLSMLAGLSMNFLLLEGFLTSWILRVNLNETNCLKDFLAESTLRAFYSKPYNIEIKF